MSIGAFKEPRPDAKIEKPQISEIVTAKGSVYRFLPDGRTRRYKVKTGEIMEPEDCIVFIPPWDLIKDQAKKIHPAIFTKIDSEVRYDDLLLQYIHVVGRTIRVVNDKGVEIMNNQEATAAGQVFLAFIDKNTKRLDFYLPVSVTPKIGYQTFDSTKKPGKNGETIHSKHIGNKVIEIKYKS